MKNENSTAVTTDTRPETDLEFVAGLDYRRITPKGSPAGQRFRCLGSEPDITAFPSRAPLVFLQQATNPDNIISIPIDLAKALFRRTTNTIPGTPIEDGRMIQDADPLAPGDDLAQGNPGTTPDTDEPEVDPTLGVLLEEKMDLTLSVAPEQPETDQTAKPDFFEEDQVPKEWMDEAEGSPVADKKGRRR